MARLVAGRSRFAVAAERTLQLTHQSLVATALREHGIVMATEPRPTSFRRYVDGRLGAPEQSVRPDGVITYEYQRLEAVGEYAMVVLAEGSPEESGDYRQGHTRFINGTEAADFRGWKPGDDMAIANFVPYSRKIEMGVMTMRISGTDRVYARAERLVRARFGNLARIDFTYRGIAGGGIISGRSGNKSNLRFPALVISVR